MARITKRQLKEDKFLSATDRLSVFLNQYWKQIASVIAGIIVVVGAIVLYSIYIANKNEMAAQALRQAKALFNEAESELESEGKVESAIRKYEEAKYRFQEALQKGGHSYTISEASFYLARCSYQLGNYDEAVSAFQNILEKHSGSLFALYARRGIGQSYEQFGDDGNLRKAIQQYDQLSKYPETYITLKAIIDKGRCYESLKEWDQAIAAYKTITDKFKWKVESALQAKAKSLTQEARNVISKYEAILGKNQSNPDFAAFMSKASEYEKAGQEHWFKALQEYDKAIFSQKEYWSQQEVSGERGRMLQDALDTLKIYEELSANTIKNITAGRRSEKQGDWDTALRFYRRAVQFDFLPGIDLFEEAQFRIDWINAMQKS
jgi:tetratricopeptide (TPR) repeat protein